MKYFLDAEFIERPGSIQLISIGIVGEDGRTFYAENTSFDEREADDWVKDNVLNKLRWWRPYDFYGAGYSGGQKPQIMLDNSDESMEMFGTVDSIKKMLLRYFAEDPSPEFWGYCADYDWVIFCWCFGKMIDLPNRFPKYCKDLKQLLDDSGKEKLPDPEGEHSALSDALWNRDLYNHLVS